MYKNSAELPCKDKKIILRNPRNYKLEQPFRIQDSYARPQTNKQSRWSEFYKYIDRLEQNRLCCVTNRWWASFRDVAPSDGGHRGPLWPPGLPVAALPHHRLRGARLGPHGQAPAPHRGGPASLLLGTSKVIN